MILRPVPKSLIAIVALSCNVLVANSQKTGDCRLWTRSGTEVPGNHILYRKPILKPAIFDLDGVSYNASDISFFQNQNGFFGNLSEIHGDKSERYALRIKEARMDIYEEIDIEIYASDTLPLDTVNADPLLATGFDYQYYSIDKSNLKNFNYKNLKTDLASNDSSMLFLKDFNRLRWLQRSLVVAALGIITYDFASQDPETLTLTPIGAFGFVMGGCSFFLDRPKRESLVTAADLYNEK